MSVRCRDGGEIALLIIQSIGMIVEMAYSLHSAARVSFGAFKMLEIVDDLRGH